MDRRNFYQEIVGQALTATADVLQQNRPTYIAVRSWQRLQEVLSASSWIDTTSTFKRDVVNTLHDLQGKYLHRAALGASPDLYLRFLDISGITWRQLSDIDFLVDGVTVRSTELDTELAKLGALVAASAVDFRFNSESLDTEASEAHLLSALHYFGDDERSFNNIREDFGARPRPFQSLTSIDFTQARTAATAGVDLTVCLSASEEGTAAVILGSRGSCIRQYPAFTTTWLKDVISTIESEAPKQGLNAKFNQYLQGLLQTLWHEVVSDILHSAMELIGNVAEPRIAWCPAGFWQRIPITAAYDFERDRSNSLLFSTHSTVIPSPLSLPWLAAARSLDRHMRILAVAAAETAMVKRLKPLTDTTSVLSDVRRSAQGLGLDITVLDAKTLTKQRVLAAISEHDVVQLHCHGEKLPGHSEASLLLYRDSIGWEDLALRHLRRTRIALLTACNTSQTAAANVSDGHSVAQALFERGIPLVVSSLWSVDAVIGGWLTDNIYKTLERTFASSPTIDPLHLVNGALRDLTQRDSLWHLPSLWAPLLVIGG